MFKDSIARYRKRRAEYIRQAAYLTGMNMMHRSVHPEVIADHLYTEEIRAQRLEAKAGVA